MQAKVLLDVETEFELMVKYQRSIESRSVLVDHAPNDLYAYGLYTLQEPIPTYEEFLQGNDFAEGELIAEGSNIVQLEVLQDFRRKEKSPEHLSRAF